MLRVPVSIELVPVLRLAPDPLLELLGEALRRGLDRLLAGPIDGNDDRLAGRDAEAALAGALDEARHQRRAGEGRQKSRRSQEPRVPAEEADRDAIAPT